MLVGLYSSATALEAAERMHEVVSENLAHVGMPGYRANVISFETFETQLQGQLQNPSPEGYGTVVEKVETDFTPGPIAHTGRKLDVAIGGDGFFTIDGPDGPLYTRNGVFFANAEGLLVNDQGLPIQGSGGPIQLPPNTTEADVSIGTDGTVAVAGTSIGQLQLVRFADNSQLVRAGTTLFQAPASITPEPSDATVMQGSREQANVSAVTELVRMVLAMRHYEASQRALTSLDEAVSQQTNPQT